MVPKVLQSPDTGIEGIKTLPNDKKKLFNRTGMRHGGHKGWSLAWIPVMLDNFPIGFSTRYCDCGVTIRRDLS